jgi:hypothetical protein
MGVSRYRNTWYHRLEYCLGTLKTTELQARIQQTRQLEQIKNMHTLIDSYIYDFMRILHIKKASEKKTLPFEFNALLTQSRLIAMHMHTQELAGIHDDFATKLKGTS